MVDFDRLITRFRQFGGWRLVWQYVRMGVLWMGVCSLIRCALKGRSFKTAYPVITEKVDRILYAVISGFIIGIDENKRGCREIDSSK